jgi:hypothetical protein
MGLREFISSNAQRYWESCKERFNTQVTTHSTSAQRRSTVSSEEPQPIEDRAAPNPARQKIQSLINLLSQNIGLHSNQSGFQKRDSLKLPSHIVSMISDAVLADREAQHKLSRLTTKYQSLNDAVGQLDRRAFGFDVRVHELELEDSVSKPGSIETMRESARIVRATQKRLKDKLLELEAELDEVIHGREEHRTQMYTLLNGILVKKHIIPDQPENAAEGSSNVQSTTNPIAAKREIRNGRNGQCIGGTQCANEERKKVLQRSAGQQNLRLLAASSRTNAEAAQHENEFDRDPKLEAERDYKYYKLLVGQAEADFDDRQDVFDQERDQLMWRRATGEADESMSQLDRRHILETQKLAQRFAKAEDNYFAAKEAAVAAGVILGSDAESGFASRDDDGYSLSMEISVVNGSVWCRSGLETTVTGRSGT